jgi:hypothetical protein
VRRNLGCLILAVVCLSSPVAAQDEERIQKLYDNAVRAMGGQTYLAVKDIVSEGNMFYFNRDGESSGLIKYYDWTKIPDKSRNEVGNKKKDRDVVVFNLERKQGWILEGQKETREAKPDEMESFQASVKHAFDNLFRVRWKHPDTRLFYLGPGEGAEVGYEMVKLLDAENDELTVFFERAGGLPSKIEYHSVSKNGVHERHVEEYSQWHEIQGVKTPLRIDGFVNARRVSQQFVVKLSYNNNLSDDFFSKPIPPK